jgi:hypothetical protein
MTYCDNLEERKLMLGPGRFLILQGSNSVLSAGTLLIMVVIVKVRKQRLFVSRFSLYALNCLGRQ